MSERLLKKKTKYLTRLTSIIINEDIHFRQIYDLSVQTRSGSDLLENMDLDPTKPRPDPDLYL